MKKTIIKRTVVILAVAAAALSFSGCEELLAALFGGETPATPLEQVEAFLAEASSDARTNESMRAFFAESADDYPNMLQVDFWDTRFFVAGEGPFALVNGSEAGEDPDFLEESVLVTGNVTNFVNAVDGYSAEFTLIPDPDDPFGDPLIRRIEVTVADTTEIITKIVR